MFTFISQLRTWASDAMCTCFISLTGGEEQNILSCSTETLEWNQQVSKIWCANTKRNTTQSFSVRFKLYTQMRSNIYTHTHTHMLVLSDYPDVWQATFYCMLCNEWLYVIKKAHLIRMRIFQNTNEQHMSRRQNIQTPAHKRLAQSSANQRLATG